MLVCSTSFRAPLGASKHLILTEDVVATISVLPILLDSTTPVLPETHHIFPISDVIGNAPVLLCSTSSRAPRGDSKNG
jgi:hypothetical protein